MSCIVSLSLALLAATHPPFVFEDPSTSLRESEPTRAVLVAVEWTDPQRGLLVRAQVRQAGRQRTLEVAAWRDERRLGRSTRSVPAKEWEALSQVLERMGARALANEGLENGPGPQAMATVYLGGDAPHQFTTLAVGPEARAPDAVVSEQARVLRELETHTHSEALARKWLAAAPPRRLPEVSFEDQPRSAFERRPPRELRILVEHTSPTPTRTTHRIAVFERPGGRLRVKALTLTANGAFNRMSVDLDPEQAKQLWAQLDSLKAWRLTDQTVHTEPGARYAADARFLFRRGGREHRFTCHGGISGEPLRLLEALALTAGENANTLRQWLKAAPSYDLLDPEQDLDSVAVPEDVQLLMLVANGYSKYQLRLELRGDAQGRARMRRVSFTWKNGRSEREVEEARLTRDGVAALWKDLEALDCWNLPSTGHPANDATAYRIYLHRGRKNHGFNVYAADADSPQMKMISRLQALP